MLDAVVCNYKTPHDLRDFLESWCSYAPAEALLTVVNVCPEQADLDVTNDFMSYDAGKISGRVMDFTDNIGYAKACNAAVRNSHADVLAFFNADVVLTEGALQECHDALLANPEWGVLGPRQVDQAGRLTHAGIVGTGEAPKHRAWKAMDSEEYADIIDSVPTVSGSAYFIKRQTWTDLMSCPIYQDIAPLAQGAFLPTEHYYEETWCSYHARAHGWKCVYFGPARIVHKWHRASVVGGFAEMAMPRSRALFRHACDQHGIPRD